MQAGIWQCLRVAFISGESAEGVVGWAPSSKERFGPFLCSQPHASSFPLALIKLVTNTTQPQTHMASRQLSQLTAEFHIAGVEEHQLSSRASVACASSRRSGIWNAFAVHTCIAAFNNSEARRPWPLLLSAIQPVHPGTEGGSLASSAVNFPTVVPARHFWRTLAGDAGIKS